jgi:transposase
MQEAAMDGEKEKNKDGKSEALRRGGALNRHAERVSDARFAEGEFFDARDLVQVKYEMLRRVRAEEASVTEASAAFGMSRISFYQAQAAFEQKGLPGLTPKKPGPRGRHKLTPEVMAFVREELARDGSLQGRDLPDRVRERFGLRVHQRTIERALDKVKKKRRASAEHQAQEGRQD